MNRPLRSLFPLVILVAAPLLAQGALPDRISYNQHIRPILSGSCFACHGPDAKHRKGKLRLDTREGAVAAREHGAAVVPGDHGASLLLKKVLHADPEERMPPPAAKKPPLGARDVALLRRWIEEGAEYQAHWSFRPVQPVELPAAGAPEWQDNGIDRFVFDRLRREGLAPSPEADRRTLIRRVTLDLTGLLPAPVEVEAFVADTRADAFERVVDRLLQSPHFGERMAVDWLDAARYGDSSAYHADGPRDMWRWRDWVIDAFNANMPYDRFTVEQLAGDLLPDGGVGAKIASGFNRNHCTSDEGGAFPEELRVGYVVDRVRTTSMVWLGLTMECAQCHDHKYDPVSQEEFYRFFAFFNRTKDPGMQTRNGNQVPVVDVLSPAAQKQLPDEQQKLAAIDAEIAVHVKGKEPGFARWLATAATKKGLAPEGLLAHFPLDRSSSSKAVAEAAAGKGGPSWTLRARADALAFDGQSFVDLGDVADFERTDRFSFGAWVKPEDKAHGAPLARMDDRDAKEYRGWDLYVAAGGPVAMHLIHSWPDDAIKVETQKKLPAGKWAHVFVTYDGSSKAAGVTIYVDGQPWKTKTVRDSLRGSTRTGVGLRLGRRERSSRYKGAVDDVRIYGRDLTQAGVALLAGKNPFEKALKTPAGQRDPKLLEPLRAFYLANHDPEWRAMQERRAAQERVLGKLQRPLTTVMMMQDELDKPRKTFRLDRGAYDRPVGDELQPGVPAALPPFGERPRDRLGLARWLTDPGHPLTARVTVNRLWHTLFGRGIVDTVEDFGAQGSYPTHPRLLDWLARDFVQSGWDVKRAIRQMVTSRTYRQAARMTPELAARDPENRLLARGPRFRLAAEFIRDTALQVSGLLVPEIGGPGVKPYQPPGLWNEVSLNKNVRFRQDTGDKLFRRSLYTYWKRSAPAPSMRIFDVPTREQCVLRRPRTNTPLQALVTLNDPQFLEAARHLARRMLREGGETVEARLDFAFRHVLARAARPLEVSVLREALEPALRDYKAAPDKAAALLSAGESKRDPHLDPAEHAAWMVVASMILNTDEALTRG